MGDSHQRISVHTGMADIVSGLPRNIVNNILERMPVRDAARTSILSRKWRYIWSSHPHVVLHKDFFEHNFIRNKPPPFSADEFVYAIEKILLLHSGPILKFFFYIPNFLYDWGRHVDQWLLFLSRNGIKELKLDNWSPNPYKLPSYVFFCPELTYLKLRSCIFKPPDSFGGFGKLVTLHFDSIAFTDDIFRTPLPTAPLLESLKFLRCSGIEHFRIHAPRLQTLNAISSSNVKSLCSQGSPNLAILSIVLGKMANSPAQVQTINLSDYLGDWPRISTLCFDGFFLKLAGPGVVSRGLSVTLNHLRDLVLYEIRFEDSDQMSCAFRLLKSCPNLHTLCVVAAEVGRDVLEPDTSYWDAPGLMNQTLNQLQYVNVYVASGLMAEFLFTKFILASSPLLRRMRVQFSPSLAAYKRRRISNELNLPATFQASPNARVEYANWVPRIAPF